MNDATTPPEAPAPAAAVRGAGEPLPGAAPSVPARPDLLRVESLTCGYGGRIILRDVDMHFPKGTVTALMGGSGSGKTTLLRAISAQIRPDSGRVLFDGQDVQSFDDEALYRYRRRIGMLFQFGALFTDIDVFENVAFPLREHTDLPDAMIRDLVLMKLQAVGLRGAASLMPSELSGGMARRVALARASALDPQLLLFDEPFAGLDPISLGTIAHLIREMTVALGATTVLVTHDVAETFRIVDYAYVLSGGHIVAAGTPDELMRSTDPTVEQFLHGHRDGPIAFNYPAPPIQEAFGL